MKKISAVVILLPLFFSCKKNAPDTDLNGIDFRQEMRNFVQEISSYARAQKPGFIIIPQNGQELLTNTGEADGVLQTTYLNAVDGTGREELYYGYDNNDDAPTPADDNNHWLQLCTLAKNNGLKVLTTDYCFTSSKIQDSYQKNAGNGFISFAANHRELDNIPAGTPYNENENSITRLSEAKNFLYLINTDAYTSKQQMAEAINKTNYDVILMDAFFQESDLNTTWSAEEINQLKIKHNGGHRLVIAYMSIGEAEDYRYYWQHNWSSQRPSWLENLNPQWQGNYEVKYWVPEWKQIITGNKNSYTQKLIDSGFDGAYLDIIDGFEYWESKL